jgi:hypothetical protein
MSRYTELSRCSVQNLGFSSQSNTSNTALLSSKMALVVIHVLYVSGVVMHTGAACIKKGGSSSQEEEDGDKRWG